jgi:protein SCO1/2
MTARTTRLLLLASAFLAGLLSVALIIVIVAGRGPTPLATAASSIGGPFSLIDQDGRPITDQDLKGAPYLMFFGFTHCPDVCPTTLFEISEVLAKVPADAGRVAAIFATVDPERDTPDKMKDYLASFDPRLRGVTGDPAAVAAFQKAFRVYSRKVPLADGDYTMDHTALVYLMNKDGQFVVPFNLKRTPEEAAADLRRYM